MILHHIPKILWQTRSKENMNFEMKRYVCLFVCLCFTSHRQRGHLETVPPFTVHEYSLFCLFVCLCLTSHRQRGHSETAPPFTVPCEGREAR